MKRVNMAEARARFPELVKRVSAGETVVVGRYGVPVAVVISYERFQEMEEDLDDLRTMVEAEIELRRTGKKGRKLRDVVANEALIANK
ncbi:MAG: type II toxin-antitoxin system Phd/YefM family antitoxin [Chloroflexi bacterium]|nr:type II toxin-antitoxin system Phd/YefM family antitoxin [Chloroflexota bacterium]